METTVAGTICEFDGFRLDRSGGGLFLADGTPVPLGSRALDILQLLIERRGEVVTKERLIDVVWSGLTVEEKNLSVQVSALRRALDRDPGGGASCIQTVAGRGYRFVSPVTWIDDSPPALPEDAEIEDAGAVPPPAASRRWKPIGATLAVLGALAICGLIVLRHEQPPHAAPQLSVVLLPFTSPSGDPADDHMAAAITADLATELARLRGSLIVRATDATPKARSDVRYALTGSIRRSGASLRINVHLIDAGTGAQFWASRFDQSMIDPAAGQDQIVQRIGPEVRTAIIDTDSARSQRERPSNPDAADLIIRARSIASHTMGLREHDARADLLQQALAIEPRSTFALTALAEELVRRSYTHEGDELSRASALLARADAVDPTDPLIPPVYAYLRMAQGRYAEAAIAYRRIIHESPNLIYALAQLGICLTNTGRAQEGIPFIMASIERETHSPYDWSRYDSLGYALLLVGRDEEAIVWLQRALAALPNDYRATRTRENGLLATAYARLGRLDEAHRAVQDAELSWPYDTVRSHWPDDPSSHEYAAQMERLQAGMRLAGVRDHAEESAEFGAVSDGVIPADLAGPTPTTVPGATTIQTDQLVDLLAQRHPVVIDALSYSWGRSLPGAVGLARTGWSSSDPAATLTRLGRKMQTLSKGDLARPIVAVGFNSERFDGHNLALRLVSLGYKNVYWYRGGREAWEVRGLPEAAIDVQDW